MRFPTDRRHPRRRSPLRWLVAILWGVAGSIPALAGEPVRAGLSLAGTTGLVNTPTADVLPDGALLAGVAVINQEWAYVERGKMNNELYFMTLGFLPRLEVSIRATVFPDQPLLEGEDVPAVDRMASARLQILKPGRWPALAVGVDDVRGTRLFHSLYLVGTQRLGSLREMEARITAGYGGRALTARNYVLDGFFGGLEVSWGSRASVLVDFDTEKVNSALRVTFFDRVSLHLALLDLNTGSGGVGWTQPL